MNLLAYRTGSRDYDWLWRDFANVIKAYKTLPTHHRSMYSYMYFKDVTVSLVTFVMAIDAAHDSRASNI